MKIRLKKLLSKYKNKIFSFIAVIACIPFLSVNTFAAESFYNTITPPELANLNANLGSGNVLSSDGLNAQSLYEFGNTTTYTASSINFIYPDSWNLDFNPDLYDYYLTLIFDSYSGKFAPNFIRITSYTASGSANHNLTDVVIDSISGRGNGNVLNGYHIIGKIPESFNGNFRSVYVSGTSGTIGKYLCAYISITQVNKGTDTAVAQSIISAINNQTSVLGGHLGNINSGINKGNDLIENGNNSTSGIVSDNNSSIDNLDEVVSEYRATEESFFNDFNANQQAITSDIVGWSWGGLVNCANWVGDTLTSYYNNMGDFRQYIIYPLMLGIALFFLGRGGSIIGHLFRKPTETTVNTMSVFRRDGNTRYTTTTTSRQGGVWRK